MSFVRQEREGEIRILTIEQEKLLDDMALQDLYKAIVVPLDETEDKHVVIDFRRVEFMSSAGLGMLIRIKKRCQDSGTALRLCGLTPTVFEVIRLTGLDRMFDIDPDRSQAMGQCK